MQYQIHKVVADWLDWLGGDVKAGRDERSSGSGGSRVCYDSCSMKILIATLKHETNSFSPVPTDIARFADWGLHYGDDAAAAARGTAMPMASYLDLAEQMGASVVTPLNAEAMPSAPVERETYEALAGRITDAVDGSIDLALLDLHGAMIAEHLDDGEGELLERIRSQRPELPIAVTCDLHCNLSKRMLANATAIIGYKTYPHIDMDQVARQVGQIVIDAMAGRVEPLMTATQLPLISYTLRQGTDDEPMRSVIAMLRDAEAEPGVLAATCFGGFQHGDTLHTGTSTVFIADGKQDQDGLRSRQLQRAVDDYLWRERAEFLYQEGDLDAQIRSLTAQPEGTVLLLDHADNCGSGGTQDTMLVVRKLHQAKIANITVVAIRDPEAVQQLQLAGKGARLRLPIGGKTAIPALGCEGEPLELEGEVAQLIDGKFSIKGPMYTGVTVDLGPSALFLTGKNMRIVLVSRHHEPWDHGILDAFGLRADRCRFVLLKSRIHYRAGWAGQAAATVLLDGMGATTSELSLLSFNHLRRPVYPVDADMQWDANEEECDA